MRNKTTKIVLVSDFIFVIFCGFTKQDKLVNNNKMQKRKSGGGNKNKYKAMTKIKRNEGIKPKTDRLKLTKLSHMVLTNGPSGRHHLNWAT